jgi:hypothetical protein
MQNGIDILICKYYAGISESILEIKRAGFTNLEKHNKVEQSELSESS